MELETGEESLYSEETIARYRVFLVIVGALAAVLAVALFFSLARGGG